MVLLLLLFGGLWTQVVSTLGLMSTPRISDSSTLNVNSTMSATRPETVDPKETTSIWSQNTPHPSFITPVGTTESSLGTSLGTPASVSMNTSVSQPTTSQEVFSETVRPSESSSVSSEPPASTVTPVIDGTVQSLETSKETNVPPVTMATSPNETSRPSVASTVSSESNSPPVTMTTEALEPSSETHGLPTTIATSSVESSSIAGGTPVSGVKIPTMSIPEPVTTRTPRRGSSGMLLVPMLVALLVVLALVALLLLWRRRQKRRTGVLTLSSGGKRNGVVDAWAGPARVPDEETTAASGPGGTKGSGALETEGSGQRPMLTTFFSRRKSRQGSLVLEELKPGPGPSLKGEEEPLVGSEDEAVETPTSDGLEANDKAAPQSI